MAEILSIEQSPQIVNVIDPGFECQMCGHQWVPSDLTKPPRRCPNAGCRTMRWDAKKYPNAHPPRPHGPQGEEIRQRRSVGSGSKRQAGLFPKGSVSAKRMKRERSPETAPLFAMFPNGMHEKHAGPVEIYPDPANAATAATGHFTCYRTLGIAAGPLIAAPTSRKGSEKRGTSMWASRFCGHNLTSTHVLLRPCLGSSRRPSGTCFLFL